MSRITLRNNQVPVSVQNAPDGWGNGMRSIERRWRRNRNDPTTSSSFSKSRNCPMASLPTGTTALVAGDRFHHSSRSSNSGSRPALELGRRRLGSCRENSGRRQRSKFERALVLRSCRRIAGTSQTKCGPRSTRTVCRAPAPSRPAPGR